MILKAHTDTGLRSENQDSYWVGRMMYENKLATLAGVFDGMGGLFGGAQSSAAVAETIDNLAKDGLGVLNDEVLLSNLHAVNGAIKRYSDQNMTKSGTTCTLLAVSEGKFRLHHVGDSRCYKIGRYGSVSKLSEDHTAFTKFINSGELVKENGVTMFQGAPIKLEDVNRMRSTLTKAIGVLNDPGIVTTSGTYNKGDMFLLASDGFWHHLESIKDWGVAVQNAFETEKKGGETVEQFLARLCEYCKEKGENDNLTVVLVKP